MSTWNPTPRAAGARSVRTHLIVGGCLVALLAAAYGVTSLSDAAAGPTAATEAPTLDDLKRDERATQIRQRPSDVDLNRTAIRVTAP